MLSSLYQNLKGSVNYRGGTRKIDLVRSVSDCAAHSKN